MRRTVLKAVNILLWLVTVGLAVAGPVSFWYYWPVQSWVFYFAWVIALGVSIWTASKLDEVPLQGYWPSSAKRSIAGKITLSSLALIWSWSMITFCTMVLVRSDGTLFYLVLSIVGYAFAAALALLSVLAGKQLFGAQGLLAEERSRRMSS